MTQQDDAIQKQIEAHVRVYTETAMALFEEKQKLEKKLIRIKEILEENIDE